MKFPLLFLLALAAPVHASPVHIALKATAGICTDANGNITLAQIADLNGGDKIVRGRMGAVCVGRIPLSGDTRCLSVGDVRLKLRQAGFHPETEALLEGASQVSVTTNVPPVVSTVAASPSVPPVSENAAPIIHRGDSIAIVIQDGGMTITTKGVAREAGAAGQSIRVHRDGVMTDLSGTVIDAQTVQIEM